MTDDVTDKHKDHEELVIDATMKENSTDNDNGFTAFFEATDAGIKIKIKFKLNLSNKQKDIIERNDLVHESTAMSDTEKATQNNDDNSNDDDDDRVSETTMAINSEKAAAEMDEKEMKDEEDKEEEAATIMPAALMPEIESVDLNKENESTNVPTNHPEIEENIETNSTENAQQEQNNIEEAMKVIPEIPGALISAIGDLLSSVLGIPIHVTERVDDDENIHETTIAPVEDEMVTVTTENDIVEHSTEQELSSSTSALEFNENVDDSKTDDENAPSDAIMPQESILNVIANEIDMKIENLANNLHDTNFMTESTPEVYTETVKDDSISDDIKNEDDVLEASPALMTEEEATKPVSIQDSVNHIMNLVRGTEDRMALENAHSIVDSVLIDHKAVNDNVNQLLNVALKEIETNFGMNENDKEIEIPTDELDVLDRERAEMIKNFETDINESLINSSIDDQDNFVPNMAKAALYNRFQYGDDF